MEEVLDAVTQPRAITADSTCGRWRYWRPGMGPTRWMFVVVDWRPVDPTIITAFGRGKVRL
ncbi:MAG TPA: hypothetical protein VF250_07250 [Conexibacter sp.]